MSTVAFNPIIDGYDGAVPPAPPPANMARGSFDGLSFDYASMQGTRPLTGLHNTPLHVGALGVLAVLVIIFLRYSGFHFSLATQVGVRA